MKSIPAIILLHTSSSQSAYIQNLHGVSLCMFGVSFSVPNQIFISAFLFIIMHNTEGKKKKKSSADASPPEQNEPKMILFCFLLFCKVMAKINSQHKTQSSSKVPVERLKGPSTNTSEVLMLAGKCLVSVTLIRIRGLVI